MADSSQPSACPGLLQSLHRPLRHRGDGGGRPTRLDPDPGDPTGQALRGWGRAGATTHTYGVPSLGTGAGGAMPDIASSGCLILWGYNRSFTRAMRPIASSSLRPA